jgi:hypothetical protein
MAFALASAAHASATRTYVSSGGMDTNTSSNCPRATPCKTFAAAYGVTQSAGEIIALDESAYGPLTITGGLSISAIEGAIITVQTGTVGITINAVATDKIILRNLQISGSAGSSNTSGILLNSGRLLVQNSTLRGLTNGLKVVANTKSDVLHTDIIANIIGISTAGDGGEIGDVPPTGPTQVRIFGGSVVDNATAFFMANPGLDGQGSTQSTILIVKDPFLTYMAGNDTFVSCTVHACFRVGYYQLSLLASENAH